MVNFRNDYYTLTAAAGYILNDKTEVHADYTFYRADDYFNNSGVGLPYGMGASEHTASVSMSRDLTKSVRLLLKYTYYNYTDTTIGGRNNYQAHSISPVCSFDFKRARINARRGFKGWRSVSLFLHRDARWLRTPRRADQSLPAGQTHRRINADGK